MHFERLACLALVTSACYSRPPVVAADSTDTNDTEGTSGSTTDDTTVSTTDTTPTSSSPTTTSPMTTTMTSGDPSTDPDVTTSPDSSTGETELGPQIVNSVPANGDMVAPLSPYFLLYFDRVINPNDAVGKITVSQGGGAPEFVSPQPCPPDADPTCIAAIMPKEFSDPDTGRLPANTEHIITVAPDFPDPDGMVNTMDQVVAFTTFDFTPNFFDDSDTISDELGGLAYDEGSESLFVVGLPGSGEDPLVRRIPIPGGVPGAASTAATPIYDGGGPYAYGIDAFAGQLYVSMSYSGDVRRYSNLANLNLNPSEVVLGVTTGLAEPNDTLRQVQSVAAVGSDLYFARGYFLATTPAVEILRRDAGNVFSIYESGNNLWDDNDFYGLNVTAGDVDGTPYIFAVAEAGIFKIRVADGDVAGSISPDTGLSQADVHLDSDGHLFVGTGSGIYVYDAASDDLELLTERSGLDASRIAIREDGDTVHVYYVRFRDSAVIGVVPITL